ncbi:hypothetical protein [Streptomyces sp. NPDC001348]
MGNAHREPLGRSRLVLDIRDRPGPPPLRFESADGRRLLLRQGERPLLLGRTVGEGCCPDLHLHHLDGYRSPLPPLRAQTQRSSVNWPHQYARWLDQADGTPLRDGRWEPALRTGFPPGVWTEDLLRGRLADRLELSCCGRQGVVPLRPLSPPDAGRVKAYRKHVREGTVAPFLLWWVSFLDGWLLLDGHDRAVAALAEGRTPHCLELSRAPDDGSRQRAAQEITEVHEHRMERLAARPPGPGVDRQRATLERAHAETIAALPYGLVPTGTEPLPGGAPAWDALASRVMFQFPGD